MYGNNSYSVGYAPNTSLQRRGSAAGGGLAAAAAGPPPYQQLYAGMPSMYIQQQQQQQYNNNNSQAARMRGDGAAVPAYGAPGSYAPYGGGGGAALPGVRRPVAQPPQAYMQQQQQQLQQPQQQRPQPMPQPPNMMMSYGSALSNVTTASSVGAQSLHRIGSGVNFDRAFGAGGNMAPTTTAPSLLGGGGAGSGYARSATSFLAASQAGRGSSANMAAAGGGGGSLYSYGSNLGYGRFAHAQLQQQPPPTSSSMPYDAQRSMLGQRNNNNISGGGGNVSRNSSGYMNSSLRAIGSKPDALGEAAWQGAGGSQYGNFSNGLAGVGPTGSLYSQRSGYNWSTGSFAWPSATTPNQQHSVASSPMRGGIGGGGGGGAPRGMDTANAGAAAAYGGMGFRTNNSSGRMAGPQAAMMAGNNHMSSGGVGSAHMPPPPPQQMQQRQLSSGRMAGRGGGGGGGRFAATATPAPPGCVLNSAFGMMVNNAAYGIAHNDHNHDDDDDDDDGGEGSSYTGNGRILRVGKAANADAAAAASADDGGGGGGGDDDGGNDDTLSRKASAKRVGMYFKNVDAADANAAGLSQYKKEGEAATSGRAADARAADASLVNAIRPMLLLMRGSDLAVTARHTSRGGGGSNLSAHYHAAAGAAHDALPEVELYDRTVRVTQPGSDEVQKYDMRAVMYFDVDMDVELSHDALDDMRDRFVAGCNVGLLLADAGCAAARPSSWWTWRALKSIMRGTFARLSRGSEVSMSICLVQDDMVMDLLAEEDTPGDGDDSDDGDDDDDSNKNDSGSDKDEDNSNSNSLVSDHSDNSHGSGSDSGGSSGSGGGGRRSGPPRPRRRRRRRRRFVSLTVAENPLFGNVVNGAEFVYAEDASVFADTLDAALAVADAQSTNTGEEGIVVVTCVLKQVWVSPSSGIRDVVLSSLFVSGVGDGVIHYERILDKNPAEPRALFYSVMHRSVQTAALFSCTEQDTTFVRYLALLQRLSGTRTREARPGSTRAFVSNARMSIRKMEDDMEKVSGRQRAMMQRTLDRFRLMLQDAEHMLANAEDCVPPIYV